MEGVGGGGAEGVGHRDGRGTVDRWGAADPRVDTWSVQIKKLTLVGVRPEVRQMPSSLVVGEVKTRSLALFDQP